VSLKAVVNEQVQASRPPPFLPFQETNQKPSKQRRVEAEQAHQNEIAKMERDKAELEQERNKLKDVRLELKSTIAQLKQVSLIPSLTRLDCCIKQFNTERLWEMKTSVKRYLKVD